MSKEQKKKTNSWNLYIPVITSPKGRKKLAIKKNKNKKMVK